MHFLLTAIAASQVKDYSESGLKVDSRRVWGVSRQIHATDVRAYVKLAVRYFIGNIAVLVG